MPYRTLSAELQKKACIDLREDLDRIQNDFAQIREWSVKQPHLNVRTDEQWLISILRGCKFSLERTKEKLELLCTMKSLIPDILQNRNPFLPEIQELLNLGIILPLSAMYNQVDPRVVLFRVGAVEPLKHRVEDCAKLMFMILDFLLNEDDNFVICGSHIIVDDTGISANHIVQFTPSTVKKLVTCLTDAYALRSVGIHVINAPSFAVKAFDLFKPFISNNILEKVHIYGDSDIDKLYKCIPLSILPVEYGGSGSSISKLTDEWKNNIESYSKWLHEDSKYCSDETKRCGKTNIADKLFGIEGSFRKLNID